MIHAIYGKYDDSIGQLIASHFVHNTGYPITGPYTAIGWIKEDKLVGQAIFNDYTGANIEIHLYFPGGGLRNIVKEVYTYVFKNLKCERLTAKPYCNNEKLLLLLERLGFRYEGTLENYYKVNDKPIHALIYKLTKNTIPNWVNINA